MSELLTYNDSSRAEDIRQQKKKRMPYNAAGETPEMTKKIEKCVENMMKNTKYKPKPGQSKKSMCIAICKAAIQKKK